MELARFWKHVAMTPWKAARCFPPATMERIAQAIAAQEARHRGEVCFVVEAELTTAQLWAGLASRERAKQLFAAEGIWNTEENNGVLVYVLLAEHKVEIVADRGIDRRVEAGTWQAIVDLMDARFRDGRFEEGALAGIEAVGGVLERHFPAQGERRNELGDRPILR
jgi:uncharacterized membrane protein